MSRAPRSSDEPATDGTWRPTAGRRALERRAGLIASLRAFFAERGVLEVETPLLSSATVADVHLHSLETRVDGRPFYLQTSPEFAMKRLLAAGSGPIFQICKAFRDGEAGRRHNPEFTILEWYRPGFDHHALMDEMDELFAHLLGVGPGERRTYGELFEEHVGFDPHGAPRERLERAGLDLGLAPVGLEKIRRDDWLQLLFALRADPHLGRGRPTFVLDYPASQAALARVRPGEPPVAERFEVYLEGVELANGFHELADPAEQRLRFETDLTKRRAAGLPAPPLDEHLLAALESGLPDCAGVAVGVDRLVMHALGASSIDKVLAFPIGRA